MANHIYSFEPFPALGTARLHLRELQLTDAPEVFAIRSNEEIAAFLSRAFDADEQQSLQFIRTIREGVQAGEWIYWAIALKGKEKLIGTICLWNIDAGRNCAEIGYELHPDQQGKGLMQEAVKTVVDFGFRVMQLQTIEATVQTGNKKSIHLLERNGFHFSRPLPPEAKFKEEENTEILLYTRQRT